MPDIIYDMLIIGGGPGGYSCALYAARAGLSVALLEKFSVGGQMTQTEMIDNYPGFDEGIDGITLGEKMRRGAERFGAKTVLTQVSSLELTGETKIAHTDEGDFFGRTCVIATGASARPLGLEQEQNLIGRGVSYCAACDAMFFRNKTVVVVGGGNTAAADAITLSRVCRKVYLVHRRDTLRATKVYHKGLEAAENIEFIWDSAVTDLHAELRMTGVTVRNLKTGAEQSVDCDGLFVAIGRDPATSLVAGQVELDAAGYILADESPRTNLPGVFAVGDVRTKALRQVVTAAADGATACHYAEEYLTELA